MLQLRPHLYAAVVLLATMSTAGSSTPELACQPTFFQLSQSTLEVSFGSLVVGMNGAVIGCEAKLATITDEEADKLRGLLRAILREHGRNLLRFSKQRSFRHKVTRRINTLLGRDVAADIFLYDLGWEHLSS